MIFHGRVSHQGSGIDGVLSASDGGEVKDRVFVRRRVVPRVVSERAFGSQFAPGDISFQHKLAFGGDLQVAGDAFDHFHRFLSEKAGQKDLVQSIRKRCCGAIGANGIRAQGHGYGKGFRGRALPVVVGPILMNMPVKTGGGFVVDLHAIHAQISFSGYGMTGDDYGKGDERATVFGPAGEDGQLGQIGVLGVDDLLAGSVFYGFGKYVGHFLELGQQFQLLHPSFGWCNFQKTGEAFTQVVQFPDIKNSLNPLEASVQVGEYREVEILWVLKEKGRSVILHHPVGDFGHFKIGAYGFFYLQQLLLGFQVFDQFLKIFKGHDFLHRGESCQGAGRLASTFILSPVTCIKTSDLRSGFPSKPVLPPLL